MLDNTKLLTTDLQIINRLALHPDFVICKPKNNYYHSICHKDFGVKLSMDFRKSVEKGQVVGYGCLEINISPHYHFNNYKHNGNDFNQSDCRKTLIDVLGYLGLESSEFEALKVVNIEFGINLIPETEIKDLINGLLFHKKTAFKVGSFPYFKKTDATKYKQIKAYAKGLQFMDIPEYGINPNTFRFEVKSKESKKIKTLGIYTSKDLLKDEVYQRLGQELVNEWENCLIVNTNPVIANINPDNVKFIKDANCFEFWNALLNEKNPKKYGRYKDKYYKILKGNNDIHTQIKMNIMDKIKKLNSVPNSTQGLVQIPHRKNENCSVLNSTQKTMMNKGKVEFKNVPSNRINLEKGTLDLNNPLLNSIKKVVDFDKNKIPERDEKKLVEIQL